jgi:hypothetical protein
MFNRASQELARAIEAYERFLRASEQLGEPALQALAHNCLGIAHQQQATAAAGRPATSPKVRTNGPPALAFLCSPTDLRTERSVRVPGQCHSGGSCTTSSVYILQEATAKSPP